MRRRHAKEPDESGAVLLTVVFALVTLISMAALVLDLAALRVNRGLSQTVADSAAAAASLDADGADGRAGCETAFEYLELNLPAAGAFVGGNCLALPTTCDASTVEVSTSASAGDWTATVTYPVADGSPLLQPSAIGQPTQALLPADGSQCDRIAVSVESTHQYLFGRVLGATSGTTEIHAVAKTTEGTNADYAFNLLVLERYDCDVLSANGNGGILVDAVYNPNTGELQPGLIAVDSDATGSCSSSGVLDTDGGNSYIRADGPLGCAGQVGSHLAGGGLLAGEGCGSIKLLAPGTPGCNYPACTATGTVAPSPVALSQRITRAPIDHRYNCKGSYSMPSGWDIEGCTEPAAPHIDNLVAAYGGSGAPAGFNTWTSAGYSCNVKNPIVVPAGNWFIDCSNFRPDTVVFQAGNVVFDGRVTMTNNAVLAVNADGTSAFPYSAASNSAVVYFRDGTISKSGQASVIFKNTMVYISETADLSMTGGTGLLEWSAPTAGNFDGLALWAETADVTKLAGSAGLVLEGIFFAPWSEINYQGNGAQEQATGQFIARKLSAGGNGSLSVRPDFDRAVLLPSTSQSQLIR